MYVYICYEIRKGIIVIPTYIRNSPKKNLAQYAYEEIKKKIYYNRIKPGELIKENELASELGISRTPIREALKMLESDDIVEVRKGIGTFVKMLSFKDIKDIFEVRKALEIIAIKTAINNITKDDIDELDSELRNISFKLENGTLTKEEFNEIDMKFHELIFRRCDNNFAKEVFEHIKLKIKQYQFLSYESLNNSSESISQHLELLEYLRKKDLETLISALSKHIDWSLKCLLFN